jgi:peptidoglycan/xylan/chitin deacetylase (PgdA/CDA1 family)
MIRNPIPWPDGAQCACAITFDVDADSLIHIARPKDSFNRLYPITMGRYGPTVGVPRILDTYRRLGLKQSFVIPAWTLERYPEAVDAIMKDGHEIGHRIHSLKTNRNLPIRSALLVRSVPSRCTGR